MSRATWIVLSVLAGLCWPGCSQAAPRGVALAPAELGSGARGRLHAQIKQARRQHPRAFEAVAELRSQLPRLARRQRGRMPTLVRPLRALGSPALMPMLNELAFEARPRGDLSDRAWRGWRVSLLEAVGRLRDRRAAPVLWAILESGAAPDPAVRRAAAVALGRLGDEATARRLSRTVLRQDRELALALVPALGECRRASTARALGAALRQASARRHEQLALRLVRALGEVGNAWAWKTPALSRGGEGEATRGAAMRALVASYPDLDSAAREAALKALALVGHRATRQTIAAAQKQATGARAEALAQLASRMAGTPLLR
jgi:hypothetical protein